MPRVGGSKR
jgi:transposase